MKCYEILKQQMCFFFFSLFVSGKQV